MLPSPSLPPPQHDEIWPALGPSSVRRVEIGSSPPPPSAPCLLRCGYILRAPPMPSSASAAAEPMQEPGLVLSACTQGAQGSVSVVRGVARVSATLVIDVRERFISAACRLYRFWKRCSVYSVVLEKVVLSRWCFVLWWTGSRRR